MYYKVLVCLLLINVSSCKLIEIKCPSICKCDIIKNLRRATCNNHNIVTLEADIPKEVEIIDLAFNHISQLDDQIFLELEYTKLRLLNLSYNKVSDIHINAFNKLNLLKTIDLSHNAIQYILPHWFWETTALEELYLNNNYLATLKNDQLESNSLMVLDISNCHITYIIENAFEKVPNLKRLDISGNYLTKIDVNLINHLNKLSILNIDNNSLSCNDELKEFNNYCKRMNIKSIDICENPFADNTKKFEKIILAPDFVDEQNSWMYEDTTDPCSSLNLNTTLNKETTEEKHSTLYYEILPWITLIFAFIFGYTMGLITAYCKIKCKCPKRRVINRRKLKGNLYEEGGLIEYMHELPESTPVPQRRLQPHNF